MRANKAVTLQWSKRMAHKNVKPFGHDITRVSIWEIWWGSCWERGRNSFCLNINNGKIVDYCGNKVVKYANLVFEGEGNTMVVLVSRGQRACVENPMFIFTNPWDSYPIHVIPDNIP